MQQLPLRLAGSLYSSQRLAGVRVCTTDVKSNQRYAYVHCRRDVLQCSLASSVVTLTLTLTLLLLLLLLTKQSLGLAVMRQDSRNDDVV